MTLLSDRCVFRVGSLYSFSLLREQGLMMSASTFSSTLLRMFVAEEWIKSTKRIKRFP